MNQPLNGTLVVGNQAIRISRAGDFADFQTGATRETQFRAVQALKSLCTSFGERRSPAMDLYRQRLHQMRSHLRVA